MERHSMNNDTFTIDMDTQFRVWRLTAELRRLQEMAATPRLQRLLDTAEQDLDRIFAPAESGSVPAGLRIQRMLDAIDERIRLVEREIATRIRAGTAAA